MRIHYIIPGTMVNTFETVALFVHNTQRADLDYS